jgi:SH3-like domain-containing protein
MGIVVCLALGSHSVIFSFSQQVERQAKLRRLIRRFAIPAVLSVGAAIGLGGCSRLRPKPAAQYVYVASKQTFLRDRVAAVSNRTATVANGDKLQVLEHGKRYTRVQTEKGEQGWIDDKAIATQEIFDQFEALKQGHKADPTVASGVVRDEVYMHVKPGRESEKFFLLKEGEKLKLLMRATLPKPLPPGTRTPVKPASPAAGSAGKAQPTLPDATPPAMEDWWLVSDARGDTGWLYSRMMDVDAPDAITKYAEGQRVIGAYVLTTVHDPEAEQEDKDIPIYVTVMGPYKAGLPYDFDQVRVFTWSIKKHRYETGFRDKNIEGYLPVTVKVAADPNGKSAAATAPVPTFSYRVLADDAGPVIPDPVTGAIVPGKTFVKTYRLESNFVRRVLPPGTSTAGEAHPQPVEKKKKEAKQSGKAKKR